MAISALALLRIKSGIFILPMATILLEVTISEGDQKPYTDTK